MQITDTLLMIRPAAFSFNEETAVDNFFQSRSAASADLQPGAVAQFDAMVEKLRAHGIDVLVMDDRAEPPRPDAVFPNNWFSTEEDCIHLFPMYSPVRRLERRMDIVDALREKFRVEELCDWSGYEQRQQFLEGTGSMVIDHENRIVYACLSPRSHAEILEQYTAARGYRLCHFTASDLEGRPVYHTNVLMCIGEGFAIACMEAIDSHSAAFVKSLLLSTGHELVEISAEQMHSFAGNMLHIRNREGRKFILMSETALRSLHASQTAQLEKFGELLSVDLSVIETEGGSARCMVAEIFLKRTQGNT